MSEAKSRLCCLKDISSILITYELRIILVKPNSKKKIGTVGILRTTKVNDFHTTLMLRNLTEIQK